MGEPSVRKQQKQQRKGNQRNLCFALAVVTVSLFCVVVVLANLKLDQFLQARNSTESTSRNITSIPIQRAHGECTTCDFSILYSDDYSLFECPMVSKWNTSHAFFEIPLSYVKHVAIRFANMGFGGASSTDLPDGKNPERMLIELCSRKGDCVVCGMSTTTEIYFWMQKEDINCTNDKFEASQIKVTIANPKLAPCRIEAHGQVLVAEAVRKLDVYLAYGNRLLAADNYVTQEHFAMNTVDDDLRTDPFYCFVAEEITNGRADLFIEWSFVTHVKLLNVVSEGHTLEGVFVFVCKDLDDKSCLPCGVARETSPGKWTTIFCTGEKVEGNRLWVTHSYDRLQVCELEIYGMQISKEERKISRVETRVYAINSNEAEDDSLMLYDYFIAEAHDFVEPWEELNGTCLPGGLFTSFVSYSFTTPAVVKYVMILTCVREGCESLEGLEIEVCDTSGCDVCGHVPLYSRGQWVSVVCDETIEEASTIMKFSGRTSPLLICQMHVFGKLK